MYTVKVKDANWHEVEVEVSKEIYELFEKERRELEREHSERRSHIVRCSLEDLLKYQNFFVNTEVPDDYIYLKELLRSVLQDSGYCQRERFSMYLMGYSLKDIAQKQHCSIPAVFYSINDIREKLKKLLIVP